jgi:glycosyltransferase involved in cell wall biosynthesis
MSTELQACPDVSAIVPARNAARLLGPCLDALLRSQDVRLEVIVVDDASTDDTAEVAHAHGARTIRLAEHSGAAAARNAGAAQAAADVLFFTDADVRVSPTALRTALGVLGDHPEASAVFGSYSEDTVPRGFFSRYKNLVHHFTHQHAREEASTFWSGGGAVRAAAFRDVGGFDPADSRGADVEDIALGYRLRKAGHRIRVERTLLVTHAKEYTFRGLVESDVLHRAIPWTRLMLRERIFRNDLNTGTSSLLSVLALGLMPVAVGWSNARGGPGLVALPGLAAAFWVLNRRLFALFARRGPRFLAGAVAMTALYYVYSVAGALVALGLHLQDRARARPITSASPTRGVDATPPALAAP